VCSSLVQIVEAAARKIHRCFERVNLLLSLLVPVSDINRAAAGRVAAQCVVACCHKILGARFFMAKG
jgi:hypothetical protein